MISDGQVKIVYNTSAFEKAQDPRLRALLQYLSTATVTDESRPIADKVAAFKQLFPEGRPHMKHELDLYDKWSEGRAEGIKEGIEQGLEKGIEIGEERGVAKGREEGIEIGQTQGRQEGIQQGREEGAIQIAIAMLRDNIGFETIAQYTQLPIETIKKLSQ